MQGLQLSLLLACSCSLALACSPKGPPSAEVEKGEETSDDPAASPPSGMGSGLMSGANLMAMGAMFEKDRKSVG